MRHAQVRYFQGVRPEDVRLTETGRRQAEAAAAALAEVPFDRVVTSGLPRTLETARIVAPGLEPETRSELREIESGDIRRLSPEQVQEMMTAAFRGVVPLDTPFLGGETRRRPPRPRPAPRSTRCSPSASWDVLLLVLHGAVNRAILSRAIAGEGVFLGAFEQSPGCVNVLDVSGRGRVDRPRREPHALRPAHARAPRGRRRWSSSGTEYLAAREGLRSA